MKNVPMEVLPNCRWRGGRLPSGRFRCFSPKLKLAHEITPSTCSGCARAGWLDHAEGASGPDDASRREVKPPKCVFLSKRVREADGSVRQRLCEYG